MGSLTRTIAVRVEKGGTLRTVEVRCAIGVARRLCTHPEVPDRRGVARGRNSPTCDPGELGWHRWESTGRG